MIRTLSRIPTAVRSKCFITVNIINKKIAGTRFATEWYFVAYAMFVWIFLPPVLSIFFCWISNKLIFFFFQVHQFASLPRQLTFLLLITVSKRTESKRNLDMATTEISLTFYLVVEDLSMLLLLVWLLLR